MENLMLLTATVLFYAVAFGICVLAAKYGFGAVPADYHREILTKSGQEATGSLHLILKAMYRAVASALFAVALAIALITFNGVQQDVKWAKLAVLAVVLIVGIPSILITYEVEKVSGVNTPWRAAAGLTAVAMVAFLLSLA
jgi:hypothetical protein